MKHLKQASVAAVLTLILSVWLFCYQLHTEGVGITVTSRLQENGLLVGLAVVIVFLFQLFQDQIGGGFAALKDQFPTVALPTTQSNPKLYRTLQLCLLVAILVIPCFGSRSAGFGYFDPDLRDVRSGSEYSGWSGWSAGSWLCRLLCHRCLYLRVIGTSTLGFLSGKHYHWLVVCQRCLVLYWGSWCCVCAVTIWRS